MQFALVVICTPYRVHINAWGNPCVAMFNSYKCSLEQNYNGVQIL